MPAILVFSGGLRLFGAWKSASCAYRKLCRQGRLTRSTDEPAGRTVVSTSAESREFCCMQPDMPYPGCHALASLLGNLELYRPLRPLLHDRRAAGDVLPVKRRAPAESGCQIGNEPVSIQSPLTPIIGARRCYSERRQDMTAQAESTIHEICKILPRGPCILMPWARNCT